MRKIKKNLIFNSMDDIKVLCSDDLSATNKLIQKNLKSDVHLISQVSKYIVRSGGKRLRPILVLLAAKALNYKGKKHINAAAIIEFIHTATLLHDDVVDDSLKRRNRDTANIVFGNQASVLVGDFLYSRAFQMMVELNQMPVMRILADATNTIAKGEVMQLMNIGNVNLSEKEYFTVIYRKTSRLFEAGMEIAAILTKQNEKIHTKMKIFGKSLGISFQLIDDSLDYSASPDKLDKNLGDDLAEGKITLPIIYAIKNSGPSERKIIHSAFNNPNKNKLKSIQEIISSTKAIEYTRLRANEFSDIAIDALYDIPDSVYKTALITIARSSVNREF